MTRIIGLMSTVVCFAACGAPGGPVAVGALDVELISASSGATWSCPNAAVGFTLRVTNTSGEDRQLEIGRIFVLTEHGPINGLVDGVLGDEAPTLKVGDAPFDGVVAAGASVEVDGHGAFDMYANYGDTTITWHTEVEVLSDGDLTKLVGESETGIWPHVECNGTWP